MKKRPRRLRHRRPPLTVPQVLAWADHQFETTGRWPQGDDGEVLADCTEKWRNIDNALRDGHRGLPKGTSLARLLAERRGVRNRASLPLLTEEQIVAWAEHHFARTGRWPQCHDGRVLADPSERWGAIDLALRKGSRGLPQGSSLPQLLAARRGVRNMADPPRLTETKILAWADAYRRRTGQWPRSESRDVPPAPGERWKTLDAHLRVGRRGLPGGFSLAQLLARERGVRNKAKAPRLTKKQILAWADAHHRRTRRWPRQTSGSVAEAPGETWRGIHCALYEGLRGLPGGDSLHQLLVRNRRKRG